MRDATKSLCLAHRRGVTLEFAAPDTDTGLAQVKDVAASTVSPSKLRRSVALAAGVRRLANDRAGWENRQCVGVAMTPIEITAEEHR